jgi:hypothetical protein
MRAANFTFHNIVLAKYNNDSDGIKYACIFKFILYFYDKTVTLLLMSSRCDDMSFLPEILVPVLVLVVVPTQRPNPTEARSEHGDQPPRVRRPLAGRPDSATPPPLPPRTSPSMILSSDPPSGL